MLRLQILWSSTKNFSKGLLGKDYFHQQQSLGRYFIDGKSYYNDMRGKANWKGDVVSGVPSIRVSGQGNPIPFPITILQYGLGCFDKYQQTQEPHFCVEVGKVLTWIETNLNPRGYLRNFFEFMEPGENHLSDNSAMAQGEALSLICRAYQNGIGPLSLSSLNSLARRIADNMLEPVTDEGTALYLGEKAFLCEVCRPDNYVVLNGWIFALFGLYDFLQVFGEDRHQKFFDASVRTLDFHLRDYIRPDGWTIYDNKGRLCSPYYHALHVSLLDAVQRLGWLRHSVTFNQDVARITKANSKFNKTRYTFAKAAEKLLKDGTRYLVVE